MQHICDYWLASDGLGGEQVDAGALLEELTPDQSAVVLDDSAFIRVIAAAGSGKTKTLVAYVLRQMLEGIDPSEIVVFTFTEKAANELRARIYALAASLAPDLNLDGIYVGTIHGWCFQLLQSSSGFSDVLVLDELHLQALFLRLYDQLGISEYSGFEFPKGVQIALDDMELAWNEGIENVNSPALSQLYESFEDFLSQNRMTTYGSMQHAALKMIQGSTELQTRLVCVDEYQDVNSIQEQLVSALHSRNCKIFAVGDPRQSIYQWRGADPNRLMILDRKFNGVSGHELNTNFRSTGEIVEFSNQISSQLLNFGFVGPMKQFRSGLLSHSLAWAETSHPVEQAEQMAEWILQLHSNGAKWGDIAILMRSVKHNIEEIMSALTARDIPVGGSISSNGSEFVLKFVVPVLRWLVSASSWREGLNDHEMEEASLALETAVVEQLDDMDRFWEAINRWRDEITSTSSNSYDLRLCFFRFIDEAGLAVGVEDTERLNGIAITSQYMRAMEEVYRRRIKNSKRKHPSQILSDLVFRISVSATDYGETRALVEESDKVVITTVHKAKGLEWPHVIVPNLQQGLFPLKSRKRVSRTGNSDLASQYGTTLSEEMRTLYVAATRARDTLLMLSPTNQKSNQHPIAGPLSICNVQRISSLSDISTIGDLSNLSVSTTEYRSLGLADLLVFDECGFEYGLRKIAGVQPSIGQELGYGLGLHELLRERIEANADWDLERFESRSQGLVRLPYMAEQDELRSQKRIAEVAFELQNLRLLDGNYQAELRTSLVLGNILIQGTIDGVLEIDGASVVRDWKTNVHSHLTEKYDQQLALYAMALKEKGIPLSGAEYVDASASAKAKSVKKTEVDISDERIAELRTKMEKVAVQISQGRVEPRPSQKSCDSCDVSRICSYRVGG